MDFPPQGHRPATSVLVLDPHPVTREGVKAMILAHPKLRLCADTGSGPHAVALAASRRPDVVTTEASCPDMGGPELVARLRAACPAAKVFVLTGRAERASLRALLAAGAAGYALKRTDVDDLARAVRAVAAGDTYLDPDVAGWVVDGLAARPGSPAAGAELSDREADVVRLIGWGYSNKEIAARLAVSVKTVETYKARSYEKLGVRSRVALVSYAVERGWLSEPLSRPAPVEHLV